MLYKDRAGTLDTQIHADDEKNAGIRLHVETFLADLAVTWCGEYLVQCLQQF